MSTKISIIIPVYNAEKTLNKAIKSILNQTLQNFQLILVDDGSYDKSPRICEQYAQKDSRIKVIHQSNSGPGSARNRGLEIANGKYLAFLDADDYIIPNAYAEMIDVAESSQSQIVMCGYRREFIRNEKIYSIKDVKIPNRNINGIEELRENFNELYLKNYFHLLWNKIYILKIIKEKNIRFSEDIRNGEDLLFNLKYFSKVSRISIYNQVLYHYIERASNSLTHKYDLNFFSNKVFLFKSVHAFVIYYLKCKTDMADYDIYLKDCFQSAEQYLKYKTLLNSQYRVRDKIQEILNCEYTKKALLTVGCGAIEYKIYRWILSFHSVTMFIFFCKIRCFLKFLLRGE